MPYVTSIERLAKEEGEREGEREGKRKGKRESVLRVLSHVCGKVPRSATTRIGDLATSKLDQLLDASLQFEGLEDLETWLDANAKKPAANAKK